MALLLKCPIVNGWDPLFHKNSELSKHRKTWVLKVIISKRVGNQEGQLHHTGFASIFSKSQEKDGL